MTQLYVLIDPRTLEIRYVGKTTVSLVNRLRGHMREAQTSDSHKSRWIRTLNGELPLIVPYGVCDAQNVNELERQAIAVLRKAGYDLTNSTDGGEGGWSDAARAAIKRGPLSDETKAKIGKANRGRKHTEETKARLREARSQQKMKPVSDETKLKISQSLKMRAELRALVS